MSLLSSASRNSARLSAASMLSLQLRSMFSFTSCIVFTYTKTTHRLVTLTQHTLVTLTQQTCWSQQHNAHMNRSHSTRYHQSIIHSSCCLSVCLSVLTTRPTYSTVFRLSQQLRKLLFTVELAACHQNTWNCKFLIHLQRTKGSQCSSPSNKTTQTLCITEKHVMEFTAFWDQSTAELPRNFTNCAAKLR